MKRRIRDWGRRPYINETYKDLIKRPPRIAIEWLAEKYGKKVPQSSFEKPYNEDIENYPAMQYYWPMPPRWTYPPFPVTAITEDFAGEEPSPIVAWFPDTTRPPGNTTCPPYMECDPTNPETTDIDGCALLFVGGMCGINIQVSLLEISSDDWKIRSTGGNFDCMHCQPAFFAEVCYEGNEPEAIAYVEFVDKDFNLHESG